MKSLKIATLSFAALVWATSAFAQHGHTGGAPGSPMGGTMGGGMSSGMDHGSNAADHASGRSGGANSSTFGSANKMTVNDILSKAPKLSSQIQLMTGMSAADACKNFKNLGQCVAAAHVSKNLGISFDCLKSDMTGTAPQTTSCPAGTGTKGMSLGKAIQTLDPTANQKLERKKAESQAQRDMKDSGIKS
jgi:hypothetical protein